MKHWVEITTRSINYNLWWDRNRQNKSVLMLYDFAKMLSRKIEVSRWYE